MEIIYIFIFIFGSIIGSFLNVVIDRLNTGRGFGGRSRCDVTGKVLKWYELIPIFSYFIQGGRSRHSKSKISIQYPLVEMGTAFLFVIVFQKFWPLSYVYPDVFLFNLFFYFIIFSLLTAIFVYDIKHQIIPDWFVWEFNILAFLSIFISTTSGLNFYLPDLMSLLAGPIVASPLLILWFVSRGRWIGFGDVKYCLGMGWLLGISSGFSALMFSFWTGALFGIIYLIFSKSKNHEIPFAPFLILGTLLAFLYNVDMSDIASAFSFLV